MTGKQQILIVHSSGGWEVPDQGADRLGEWISSHLRQHWLSDALRQLNYSTFMLKPKRIVVCNHLPLICLKGLYWEKWKGAIRTMTLAIAIELSPLACWLVSLRPNFCHQWWLSGIIFTKQYYCLSRHEDAFLDALCPCPHPPRVLPTLPMAFRLWTWVPDLSKACPPHLAQHWVSPLLLQQVLLLKSLGIWGLVLALLICSTWTQGPTMRASVAVLILATNTSHIILYKENIEGETFGH